MSSKLVLKPSCMLHRFYTLQAVQQLAEGSSSFTKSGEFASTTLSTVLPLQITHTGQLEQILYRRCQSLLAMLFRATMS